MGIAVKDADPRVKRTRQLLYQALMELWQEKGLRAITVQDLTERATINRATFYAHFQDKFDLLESFLRDVFRQRVAHHLPAGASWSLDNLHRLVLTVFEFFAEMNQHCSPKDQEFEALFDMTLQSEVAGMLLSWFRDPAFPGGPPGVPAEILANTWTSAVFGVASQWSRGPRSTTAPEMVTHVMLVLTASLRPASSS